jgi:hypothetical protein
MAAAEVRDHSAAIDAEMAARRREAAEADALRARAESEAAAISAALDDDLLGRVLDHVRTRVPGPLGSSAVGLTRTTITWARAAAARTPGDLPTGIRLALADSWAGPEPGAVFPPLPKSEPPPDTPPLIDRVRQWLDALRPTG